ncbi:MAG: pantoate--beta-alanine ligase [Planctomycetota bacterium]|nr:MAG: pantoate--beta-alanine ligase [Planctomycetota bacterium]
MAEITARSLQVLTRGEQIRSAVLAARNAGETVGFVPTMGALHEGHLSLVDAAAAECDRVAASIFVNPTQFGPHEDFAKYPRDLQRDLTLLRQRGCDWAFTPEPAEMYPPGFSTSIDVGPTAAPWEGAARPGHFAGVATVVHKLLQLVPAHCAYFGQKDYQQTLVVRRMAADLNLPVEIRVCPIVRDADGLALSSRNVYLSADERRRALALSQSLKLAESLVRAGETDVAVLRKRMLAHIASVGGVAVEYIAFLPEDAVVETTRIDGPVVVAIAARVGGTRLIDNWRI